MLVIVQRHMLLMINGLMENIPYVFKIFSEIKKIWEKLMEVRPNFLEMLHENGFHVSGVVYD